MEEAGLVLQVEDGLVLQVEAGLVLQVGALPWSPYTNV